MKRLIAEFTSPDALLTATKHLHDAEVGGFEAFTPFPVPEFDTFGGQPRSTIPWLGLIGGLVGGIGFFLLQAYAAAISYPVDVGGRPLFAWPYFLLPAWPVAVIGSAAFAFFGFFVLNGLPRLNHPLFELPQFARVTRDRFFLCFELGNLPDGHRQRVGAILRDAGALSTEEIE